jgi:PTH1 family peptidyl-tRNA hydrolase
VRLVVGLGNPGTRYSGTPHNVGFRVLEHFAEHLRAAPAASVQPPGVWTGRFGGEFMLARMNAEELVLLKPLTFMNRSGISVREAGSFYEISPADTLVVHDEVDLPFGSVKLKRGGGEAGHHGLESISAEVGSREYSRCRVGVGKPAEGPLADYLLSPLPASRSAELQLAVAQACNAIELVIHHGLERAMNLVNRQATGARPPEAGRSD